jgi:hypothetical protein
MAILKANYIRRGVVGNERAKDAIRYMQHRPGFEGARITRQLFGPDGVWGRDVAYRMIDEAPAGTHFYRGKLSPDPTGEDGRKDLDLRDLTARTIRTLEAMVNDDVYYVAAVHAEHADHRHIYFLASVPRRLNKPEIEGLRDAATQVCLEQRQERDREARESTTWEREPEEDAWAW